MLESIKALINQKQQILEAANLIFEDVSGNNLDDSIVLGESEDDGIQDELEEKEKAKEEDIEDKDNEDNDEDDLKLDDDEDKEDDEDIDNDEDDIMNKDINDKDDEDELDKDIEDDHDNDGDGEDEDDIMNSDINPSMPYDPSDIDSELPTPVGAQTDEPIEGSIDDILDVEIDLQNNTIKDVLPIPPVNAGDAIIDNDDDFMNQRIDSGFGESSKENDLEDDILNEAIDLGNDQNNNNNQNTVADDPSGVEDPSSAFDDSGDAPADQPENDVTSAVRDKVSEADMGDDTGDSTNVGKETLLKKLGNITKNLEDAKKAIMDSM